MEIQAIEKLVEIFETENHSRAILWDDKKQKVIKPIIGSWHYLTRQEVCITKRTKLPVRAKTTKQIKMAYYYLTGGYFPFERYESVTNITIKSLKNDNYLVVFEFTWGESIAVEWDSKSIFLEQWDKLFKKAFCVNTAKITILN